MGFMGRGFMAAVSLLWVLGATVSCSQQGAHQQKEKLMPEKTIEAILKELTDTLMSLPGVIGTAQGECAGKPCIKVFVAKKTSDLLKQIPSTIEGYKVEVQETGEIKALDRR